MVIVADHETSKGMEWMCEIKADDHNQVDKLKLVSVCMRSSQAITT